MKKKKTQKKNVFVRLICCYSFFVNFSKLACFGENSKQKYLGILEIAHDVVYADDKIQSKRKDDGHWKGPVTARGVYKQDDLLEEAKNYICIHSCNL